MVLGLDAQIFEDGVGPESFHVVLMLSAHKFHYGVQKAYPVLNLSVANRIVNSVT